LTFFSLFIYLFVKNIIQNYYFKIPIIFVFLELIEFEFFWDETKLGTDELRFVLTFFPPLSSFDLDWIIAFFATDPTGGGFII
jgi:hypothetical protein